MPFNMKNISYSDFKNICRMCMLSCDKKFVQDDTISVIFYKLTDIQFETNDELPQQICLKCFEKINEIHDFAFACKQTHESLLKCVNDFKNTQMIEEQETLQGINKPFKTEEEITIDDHEIEFLKVEVLNSTSECVIDELKFKEVIEEDKNNELEENMIAENRDNQNINCSKDDVLKLNTLNIKVENEEESDDNVNLNDSNEDTYLSDISVSSYMDSTENNEDIFRKTKDKQLKCDVCNRTFISLKLFKKHKILSSCERPKRSEQLSYNIKSHMNAEISKKTKRKHSYKCEQCSKSFSRSSTLKYHMHTHSGEQPYKCELCLKSFSYFCSLKRHLHTHSGERPYKCKQCSKSFSQSSHLKNHMRTHSGERPYKCAQCSKSFSQSSTLDKHMYTHRAERDYKCEQCSKSFSRPDNLKVHIHTHRC